MGLNPSFPIQTRRLLLRPLELSDAEALLAYRSLPEVCRFVPFEPMSLDVIRARISGDWSNQSLDDEGQGLMLGVVRRDTGELIGDVILFWRSREHRGGEIGYVFNPAAAGHGYATEAAHALLHLGFDDLDLRRMIARLDARNNASAQVLRRLGMGQEAYLVQNEWFKGEWSDELDFAILRDEWAALHAGGDCPVRPV
jgi:RimJ/RimL family protein N-acetyltransferase